MATDWDPEDIEKAAYHEAGHAIVAWSLDLQVDGVYLDPVGNSGHAMIALAKDPIQQVTVWYAGFEAEDIFKGPAAFVRAEEDFLWANEELTKKLREEFGQRKMVQSAEGRWFQISCRARAQELLRQHKDRVERVVKELLQPPHEIKRERFEQLMQAES